MKIFLIAFISKALSQSCDEMLLGSASKEAKPAEFLVSKVSRSQADAHKFCKTWGGNLATIENSEDEEGFKDQL